MSVEVSLLKLVCLEKSEPLWPAEFRALIQALEAQADQVPEERGGWSEATDWCREHGEDLLADAFRFVAKHREVEIHKESWGHWALNKLPQVLKYRPGPPEIDRSRLTGPIAWLAHAIEEARKELE